VALFAADWQLLWFNMQAGACAGTKIPQSDHRVFNHLEVKKKQKYLAQCESAPLVFLVDGMMGVECDAARKRLASRLATKWNRIYSKVCGVICSRLAIAP
jgi:hypothetical protein